MTQWEQAQKWESSWWGNCSNTVWEDVKQINLAIYLGLKIVPNAYTQYRIPMNGESILDIGGGPSSLLLKCENIKGTVADPGDYPKWIASRYEECGISYYREKGEDIDKVFKGRKFDEVWIYNCLQHTEDPERIVNNARALGNIVRVFEWIETGTNEGHPHTFTKEIFDKWFDGEGKVHNLSGGGLYGKAYTGVFLGADYKEVRQ